LYQFVHTHPDLFSGSRTTGPLATPRDVPTSFETFSRRRALQEALDRGDVRPMEAGERVWVFPRIAADGSLLVHLVNIEAHSGKDRLAPRQNVLVRLPRRLWTGSAAKATLYRFDGNPVDLPVTASPEEVSVTVPMLDLWAIVRIR
jgi:hypothetical protein